MFVTAFATAMLALATSAVAEAQSLKLAVHTPTELERTAWMTTFGDDTAVFLFVLHADGDAHILKVPMRSDLRGKPILDEENSAAADSRWWVQNGDELCIGPRTKTGTADDGPDTCETARLTDGELRWGRQTLSSLEYDRWERLNEPSPADAPPVAEMKARMLDERPLLKIGGTAWRSVAADTSVLVLYVFHPNGDAFLAVYPLRRDATGTPSPDRASAQGSAFRWWVQNDDTLCLGPPLTVKDTTPLACDPAHRDGETLRWGHRVFYAEPFQRWAFLTEDTI